ncbi:MAG: diguanylate cyclase [Pseudomonadales bacterium]
MALDGVWGFQWIPPELSRQNYTGLATPARMKIPGDWVKLEGIDHGKFDLSKGRAVYRLSVHFDAPRRGLMLFPGRTTGGHQIGIRSGDTEEVIVFDSITTDGLITAPYDFVPLPDLAKHSEIILYAENSLHLSGGIAESPVIAGAQAATRDRVSHYVIAAAFLSAYVIFSVFNLVLWLGDRSKLVFLALTGICVVLSVRVFDTQEFLSVFYINVPLTYHWHIGWGSFFAGIVVWMFYFRVAYPKDIPKVLSYILIFPSVIGLFLIVFASPETFLDYGHKYRVFVAVGVIFFLYFIGKAAWIGREGARVTAAAGVFVALCTLADMFTYMLYERPYVDYVTIGSFVFVAVQTIMSAAAYTSTLKAEANLTGELHQLNQSLERKVTERTTDLARTMEKLEVQAMRDPLTNLYNRRYFIDRMREEAAKQSPCFCLAMLDIDHFKQINDQYGHDAGDQVLVFLAEILTSLVREPDVVTRMGGEEFSLILAEIGHDQALPILERIRTSVEAAVVSSPEGDIRFTVSIGWVAFQSGMAKDGLVAQADKALYRAKQLGRNRVVQYTEEMEINA